VKDVDRIRKHTGVRNLSRVSFWGIPFTQYHILFPPCQLKKGNSNMDSSVQYSSSRCFKLIWKVGKVVKVGKVGKEGKEGRLLE
jgi:hypothetical protein